MELFKRVVLAVIFIPVILGIFYFGGIALLSFLSLIVFFMMFEMREMFLQKGVIIPIILLPVSILIFISLSLFGAKEIIFSILLIFIIVLGNDLFRNRLEGSISRVSTSIFSIVYSAVFLSTVYRISVLENGNLLILSLLILLWITDTFAYFTGLLFGKHRGIFKASPKKSVEGFLGGLFFALIGGFVIYIFADISIDKSLAAAICAGVFGQFGDLFESILKRDAGVKDSSNLLPGHG
nr:phosphatidate cytidylyltransferase [Candidatus Cloacimonadota bacterium]